MHFPRAPLLPRWEHGLDHRCRRRPRAVPVQAHAEEDCCLTAHPEKNRGDKKGIDHEKYLPVKYPEPGIPILTRYRVFSAHAESEYQRKIQFSCENSVLLRGIILDQGPDNDLKFMGLCCRAHADDDKRSRSLYDVYRVDQGRVRGKSSGTGKLPGETSKELCEQMQLIADTDRERKGIWRLLLYPFLHSRMVCLCWQ